MKSPARYDRRSRRRSPRRNPRLSRRSSTHSSRQCRQVPPPSKPCTSPKSLARGEPDRGKNHRFDFQRQSQGTGVTGWSLVWLILRICAAVDTSRCPLKARGVFRHGGDSGRSPYQSKKSKFPHIEFRPRPLSRTARTHGAPRRSCSSKHRRAGRQAWATPTPTRRRPSSSATSWPPSSAAATRWAWRRRGRQWLRPSVTSAEPELLRWRFPRSTRHSGT